MGTVRISFEFSCIATLQSTNAAPVSKLVRDISANFSANSHVTSRTCERRLPRDTGSALARHTHHSHYKTAQIALQAGA